MQPMTEPTVPRRQGTWRRYLPVVVVVVVAAVVAGVLAGSGGKSNKPHNAATAASSGPMTPARAKSEGKSVNFGSNCDPRTGRIKVPTIYAPPCVAPMTGGNGGTTSPGVTGDTINVAFYVGQVNAQTKALNAVGGVTDTPAQEVAQAQNYVTYFNDHYELWGRKVKLVPVQATGSATDDAAAKADAIKVATEDHAFASIGGPAQTAAYADELAARGVLCLGCLGTDAQAQANAPFMWGDEQSPEQYTIEGAKVILSQFAGKDAVFAGDKSMHSQPRRFGLVAYDTPTGTYTKAREELQGLLAKGGVQLAANVNYFLDTSTLQETATTIVSKLKASNVTTVIFAGDPYMPYYMTRVATAQNYFPEWIVTGTVLTDTTFAGRLYDQKQWAHAFGISLLTARAPQQFSDAYRLNVWQFGAPPVAKGTYGLIYPPLFDLFTGVQLAGAHLTPQTFRDGLFRYPVTGGSPINPQISWGHHGVWPNTDYTSSDDFTFIWWNAALKGIQDEVGTVGNGAYEYVNGGKRYLPTAVPSSPVGFFNPTGAVAVYAQPPASASHPNYPSPAGTHP
ncbi:MAG: hypothetical protein ACRD0I_06265 [Acidimicrobiales bacterium]